MTYEMQPMSDATNTQRKAVEAELTRLGFDEDEGLWSLPWDADERTRLSAFCHRTHVLITASRVSAATYDWTASTTVHIPFAHVGMLELAIARVRRAVELVQP
jgi:S-methylmethionine-dependent homocysteine/selenocysteine methylase